MDRSLVNKDLEELDDREVGVQSGQSSEGIRNDSGRSSGGNVWSKILLISFGYGGMGKWRFVRSGKNKVNGYCNILTGYRSPVISHG